jgi:hypothetical protein
MHNENAPGVIAPTKSQGPLPGVAAVATGSGLLIWRVLYDWRFESSSGMQGYHIDHKGCTGLIATASSALDLDAVRQAICRHHGAQARLMAIHDAHYIGTTINDPND